MNVAEIIALYFRGEKSEAAHPPGRDALGARQ
jgi:hypothetical protein